MKRREFLKDLWLSVSGMVLATISPKLTKTAVNPAIEETKMAMGVTAAAHPLHPTWAQTWEQGVGHSIKTAREDGTNLSIRVFRCPGTDGEKEVALARVWRWEVKDHNLRGTFLSRDDEWVSIGECEIIPEFCYIPVAICTLTSAEMDEFQQGITEAGEQYV